LGSSGTGKNPKDIDSILNYNKKIPLKLEGDQNTLTYISKRKNIANHIGYKSIFDSG